MTLFLICIGDNNLLMTDTARRCFYPSHPSLFPPHLFYYHDTVLDLHSLSRQLLQHVGKARSSSLGTLTHRQYDSLIMGETVKKDKATQQDRRLEQDKDKDQGLDKNSDNDNKDKDKDKEDKDKGQGADQDPLLSDPSSPGLGLGLGLALVPQIHADSCHYCAGGLFRAANLLLFDVINHRQQCPYT